MIYSKRVSSRILPIIVVTENSIENLNIAGSRASKDSDIYDKTFEVVKSTIRS